MKENISGAMILAAGLGSRLKPWTDHHPKALAIVNGKSLLQRNIEYLQQFGVNNIVVNVHHFANQIVDAIEKNKGWGSQVTISDETDEVLETGGGLLKAAPLLQSYNSFVVLNVDMLTNLDLGKMMECHNSSTALATLAVTQRKTSRYFLANEKAQLVGWCNDTTGEQKLPVATDPSNLHKVAFSGIHIINKEIFNHISFTGKFSMVEVYLELCKNHFIQTYDHTGDILQDVGKPESVVKAEGLFK
jgi:N-acetyl-alpha-D-muramate 1-phosphate uridylyltransferase